MMSLADGVAWEQEQLKKIERVRKSMGMASTEEEYARLKEEEKAMLANIAEQEKVECEIYEGMPHKDEDDSGGSCGYYEILVEEPNLYHEGKAPYLAECGEITEALGMDPISANIFKELWRTAAAKKLGKKKKGHTELRAAEKIFFFAERNLKRTRFDYQIERRELNQLQRRKLVEQEAQVRESRKNRLKEKKPR